jgi:hypothetical protein
MYAECRLNANHSVSGRLDAELGARVCEGIVNDWWKIAAGWIKVAI